MNGLTTILAYLKIPSWKKKNNSQILVLLKLLLQSL